MFFATLCKPAKKGVTTKREPFLDDRETKKSWRANGGKNKNLGNRSKSGSNGKDFYFPAEHGEFIAGVEGQLMLLLMRVWSA